MERDGINVAEMKPKKRAGRRIFKETRHPIYRGVRRRNGDKWVCEVREPINQRRVWLGTYPVAEMAARAHDVAVLALRGRSACLNFSDSAWRLPVPESTDPDTIRRTAAEAAEMFRPPEFSTGITVLPLSGEFETSEGEGVAGMMMRLAEEPLMSPPRSYIDMNTSVYAEEEMCYEELSLWSY
ncbi:PREDICTED: dehydration-responsive element-binding protein 1E [Camelina sativa]|uniref:Dehydration-responsive element-binding protein 1E n=1 Tax=Camelina sativa TaxID=90675 RepID=A0ABM0WN63_CAMSA|nr:PREDICTED: dehydration-responsive element-binding protein 1E [Camelina sativa]